MRSVSIILNAFLGLTSIVGGIGLIAGFGAPPLDLLKGSLFGNYFVPGFALLIVVGGLASVATFSLIRGHDRARVFSLLSAAAIVIFEIVEVVSIGSPEGAARSLQIVYFSIGILVGVFSLLTKPRHPSQKASP